VEVPIAIDQPDGPRLEARLGRPALGAPAAGLVLCHPHPQYGGDMENPVVVRAGAVARERGLLTLRFNFRGVGASEGSYDGGRGEVADARAAAAAARKHLAPSAPIGILGYSFGAWVASRLAATDAQIFSLCLIAPPLTTLDFEPLRDLGPRLLVAVGTRDPYCPLETLAPWLALVPGAQTVLIDGADHFFSGKLCPLATAVGDWVVRWADPSGPNAGEACRGGSAR
jgi:uncharacterized protein